MTCSRGVRFSGVSFFCVCVLFAWNLRGFDPNEHTMVCPCIFLADQWCHVTLNLPFHHRFALPAYLHTWSTSRVGPIGNPALPMSPTMEFYVFLWSEKNELITIIKLFFLNITILKLSLPSAMHLKMKSRTITTANQGGSHFCDTLELKIIKLNSRY